MAQNRKKRDTTIVYDPFDRRKRVVRWFTIGIIVAVVGSLILTLGPVNQMFW